MLVTTKIHIDLMRPTMPVVVNAVQNDANTRSVEIQLYSGGAAWQVPEGVTAAIGYKKPDGTSGVYDKLPDKQIAVTISADKITAILAPQMFTIPGNVSAAIVLSDGNHQDQLTTFPFSVHVDANPAADAIPSEDYYNYTSWEDLSKAADSWFAEQNEKVAAAIDNANAAAGETLAAKDSFLETAGNAIEEIRKVVDDGTDAPPIVCDQSGSVITMNDASSRLLQGLRLFGKTTQNGTPTPEAPVALESVGDGGSIKTSVYGANLVDKNNLTYSASNGGTLTVNGEVITASSYASYGQVESRSVPAIPGATMYVSCKGITGGNNALIRCCANNGTTNTNFGSQLSGTGKVAVTVPNDAVTVRVRMYINGTSSALSELVEASFDSVMLSYVDAEYEPYKEPPAVTVSTRNGLRGISVPSGSNYTDENGQRWWCDTVNFETGKIERRTITAVLNGTHTIAAFTASGTTHHRIWFNIGDFTSHLTGNIHLCTHLTYTTTAGVTGWYVTARTASAPSYVALTLPDEIAGTTRASFCAWLAENPMTVVVGRSDIQYEDLTATEVAQYAALHTNYPNTTVFNDGGADMEVRYVADTKLYIDKKFAELAQAMLSQ